MDLALRSVILSDLGVSTCSNVKNYVYKSCLHLSRYWGLRDAQTQAKRILNEYTLIRRTASKRDANFIDSQQMKKFLIFLSFLSLIQMSTLHAQHQDSKSFANLLAPKGNGKLRASINLGNPILANKDTKTGAPYGVSIDLARALAKELNLELELVVFDSAGKSVQAVQDDQADVGFFAIDPLRGEGILFTDPYVLIEGSYLVREDSPLKRNDEVDRQNINIAVGKGSAYDLFLTREIKQATLLRAPTSPAVVDLFIAQNLDVAAGVKQQLEADMKRFDHLRLLPGRFMVIEQAMGIPKNRGELAQKYLREFVNRMKQSGMVSQSLKDHRIEGASVAP
jgi:polar amino acid transport system substrate-binding protein